MASSFLMRFLDHTQRRTIAGRTPLDEWSARRGDLYLTTHNTHNRQTFMLPAGLEPTISAGEQPQTYALDRAVIGTGAFLFIPSIMNYECLLYTNICTNKWCKFVLNYCDMFRCQYTIFMDSTFVLAKSKVKRTLVQALRLCTGRTAHRESRGIALLFHDHGTRRVEGSGSRPGYALLWERPGTYCTGGWVGPRVGLDRCGQSRPPTGIRSPDHPARSQSLYRLSYPAHCGS